MTDFHPDQKTHRGELVKALRSGFYLQTKNYLAKIGADSEIRYCCLGVACVVAGIPGNNGHTFNGALGFHGNFTRMPQVVMDYYGFQTSSGDFDDGREIKIGLNLVDLNDKQGWNFTHIADLIEQEPKGMFVEAPVNVEDQIATDSDTDVNDH